MCVSGFHHKAGIHGFSVGVCIYTLVCVSVIQPKAAIHSSLCCFRSPVTDSEEEDSAESSTDEEDEPALDSPDDRPE